MKQKKLVQIPKTTKKQKIIKITRSSTQKTKQSLKNDLNQHDSSTQLVKELDQRKVIKQFQKKRKQLLKSLKEKQKEKLLNQREIIKSPINEGSNINKKNDNIQQGNQQKLFKNSKNTEKQLLNPLNQKNKISSQCMTDKKIKINQKVSIAIQTPNFLFNIKKSKKINRPVTHIQKFNQRFIDDILEKNIENLQNKSQDLQNNNIKPNNNYNQLKQISNQIKQKSNNKYKKSKNKIRCKQDLQKVKQLVQNQILYEYTPHKDSQNLFQFSQNSSNFYSSQSSSKSKQNIAQNYLNYVKNNINDINYRVNRHFNKLGTQESILKNYKKCFKKLLVHDYRNDRKINKIDITPILKIDHKKFKSFIPQVVQKKPKKTKIICKEAYKSAVLPHNKSRKKLLNDKFKMVLMDTNQQTQQVKKQQYVQSNQQQQIKIDNDNQFMKYLQQQTNQLMQWQQQINPILHMLIEKHQFLKKYIFQKQIPQYKKIKDQILTQQIKQQLKNKQKIISSNSRIKNYLQLKKNNPKQIQKVRILSKHKKIKKKSKDEIQKYYRFQKIQVNDLECPSFILSQEQEDNYQKIQKYQIDCQTQKKDNLRLNFSNSLGCSMNKEQNNYFMSNSNKSSQQKSVENVKNLKHINIKNVSFDLKNNNDSQNLNNSSISQEWKKLLKIQFPNNYKNIAEEIYNFSEQF